MINEGYYYYQKKYKSKAEKKEEISFKIKQKLFLFFSKNKYLEKKLHVIDRHTKLQNERDIQITHNFNLDRIFFKNHAKNFKNLKLPYISFFEVIEIEKFDNFKKNLITKFSTKHSGLGREIRYKDELKRKLSNIKLDMDSSGFGKLINLDFNELKTNHSDYIDLLRISYIKTYESYFILHIEVKPSEMFKNTISKIFNSSETSLSSRHFHSFKNILKHKQFTSHTSFKGSLARENIDNLISDLQFQIDYNIFKPLGGYFTSSKLTHNIPKIEHYTIKNFKKYKEDNTLDSFFNFSNIIQFTSNDELVDIYTNKKDNVIQIIKEEEHGKKIKTGSDHTDYDLFESYHLIKSMAFPCVFDSLLNQEFSKINNIKRKIYDFLEDTSKRRFYNLFLIFNQNNKYIKLKKEITRLNLISNRYKNEFDDNALYYLINQSGDINQFRFSVKNKRKNNEDNLLNYYVKSFHNQIEFLTRKKDDINIVFKNIEELNSYRTNFILQIVSLIIGILAFVFAFEIVREYIVSLLNR